ncbi:hypothetical protein GCM10027598_76010 [Amycolatopsis oliviviridis]|uniref:Uncharacterized protein n=1 Tax=Amycolatopsis oliviviridis TaxID=1471590 RepID=A0ABQ3LD75_9PSEU|nr:hypothetical protein [Amycolatopsis oliviviridis]GHH03788.1 hypothetical protein GCM10017790_05950 [Amycolatopsis oliviviridis]
MTTKATVSAVAFVAFRDRSRAPGATFFPGEDRTSRGEIFAPVIRVGYQGTG